MSGILDGRYLITKELGSGQFSKVYLATDVNNKKYAIKIIPKYADDPTTTSSHIALLNAEVTALTTLTHPTIVRLIDYSDSGRFVLPNQQEKEVIYMVLEYIPNSELFDYIKLTGKLSENMCRLFFLELLDAVNYLHCNNICHRDLKLENLMIDSKYHLKLLDFGFSIPTLGHDGSGLLNSYKGTPLYMAPEIHEGKKYYGRSVDIFALGVILFILYSGHPPFLEAKSNNNIYN